jgi:hypothetical protein
MRALSRPRIVRQKVQTNHAKLFDVSDPFHTTSRLKIKRAYKHVDELNTMLGAFAESNFYAIKVEHDPKQRTNFVCFDIDITTFPMTDAALTIGDALHNLRSALDHLWYQVVLDCGGTPTYWTSFPIRDAGDSVVNALNSALEKKQINTQVAELVMGSIKPYQGGNNLLYGLDQLNARNKHELLIPVLKLMQFSGVHLEDSEHRQVGASVYYMDESSRVRLRDADDRMMTLKDKGRAAATILFDVGTALWGEAIIPTLTKIAEEITRTIDAFEVLGRESTHGESAQASA